MVHIPKSTFISLFFFILLLNNKLAAQDTFDPSNYETPDGFIKTGTIVIVAMDRTEWVAEIVEAQSKDRYFLREIGGTREGLCWRQYIEISPNQSYKSEKDDPKEEVISQKTSNKKEDPNPSLYQ